MLKATKSGRFVSFERRCASAKLATHSTCVGASVGAAGALAGAGGFVCGTGGTPPARAGGGIDRNAATMQQTRPGGMVWLLISRIGPELARGRVRLRELRPPWDGVGMPIFHAA